MATRYFFYIVYLGVLIGFKANYPLTKTLIQPKGKRKKPGHQASGGRAPCGEWFRLLF